MLITLAAPIAILAPSLAVAVAYCYLWPVKVKRPRLFLTITLATGLVVAGIAIFWFFSAFIGVEIAAASPRSVALNTAFEIVVRNRLLVAVVFAALVEYLLCRITQTIMDI